MGRTSSWYLRSSMRSVNDLVMGRRGLDDLIRTANSSLVGLMPVLLAEAMLLVPPPLPPAALLIEVSDENSEPAHDDCKPPEIDVDMV